jgi:hypothetical protein
MHRPACLARWAKPRRKRALTSTGVLVEGVDRSDGHLISYFSIACVLVTPLVFVQSPLVVLPVRGKWRSSTVGECP